MKTDGWGDNAGRGTAGHFRGYDTATSAGNFRVYRCSADNKGVDFKGVRCGRVGGMREFAGT